MGFLHVALHHRVVGRVDVLVQRGGNLHYLEGCQEAVVDSFLERVAVPKLKRESANGLRTPIGRVPSVRAGTSAISQPCNRTWTGHDHPSPPDESQSRPCQGLPQILQLSSIPEHIAWKVQAMAALCRRIKYPRGLPVRLFGNDWSRIKGQERPANGC